MVSQKRRHLVASKCDSLLIIYFYLQEREAVSLRTVYSDFFIKDEPMISRKKVTIHKKCYISPPLKGEYNDEGFHELWFQKFGLRR